MNHSDTQRSTHSGKHNSTVTSKSHDSQCSWDLIFINQPPLHIAISITLDSYRTTTVPCDWRSDDRPVRWQRVSLSARQRCWGFKRAMSMLGMTQRIIAGRGRLGGGRWGRGRWREGVWLGGGGGRWGWRWCLIAVGRRRADHVVVGVAGHATKLSPSLAQGIGLFPFFVVNTLPALHRHVTKHTFLVGRRRCNKPVIVRQ